MSQKKRAAPSPSAASSSESAPTSIRGLTKSLQEAKSNWKLCVKAIEDEWSGTVGTSQLGFTVCLTSDISRLRGHTFCLKSMTVTVQDTSISAKYVAVLEGSRHRVRITPAEYFEPINCSFEQRLADITRHHSIKEQCMGVLNQYLKKAKDLFQLFRRHEEMVSELADKLQDLRLENARKYNAKRFKKDKKDTDATSKDAVPDASHDASNADSPEVNDYKLRAECEMDVTNFQKLVGDTIENLKVEAQDLCGIPIPDVEVTFSSRLSLSDIQQKLKSVEDGHVMYETVQPEHCYTGERVDPEYPE